MTREAFLKLCGILGVGTPFYSLAGLPNNGPPSPASGKVAIVGAGAAGLSVGFLLKQRGIDFTILEASTQLGGRMKTDESFTDFPLCLGAEWISTDNLDFSPLADTQEVLKQMETVNYLPTDAYNLWADGKLFQGTLNTFNDMKFKNTSWLGLEEA